MRRPGLALALASLASVARAASADAAPDVGAVVAGVLSAYGGRPALERARVVRQEGTVTSMMREGAGRIVRLLQRPGSLRVEIAYPGAPPEVRVVHGGHGDRDGREVTGTPMHAAMVLQAARLALPLSLAAPGAHVADRGQVERGGRRLRALALALPDGMELVVEIDAATRRIVRSSGSIPGPGPGGRIEFATEYSDFRKVGGVLFAFHEESWARGQHTGATRLSKVELLEVAPADAFDEEL